MPEHFFFLFWLCAHVCACVSCATQTLMTAYLKREEERVAYVEVRKGIREKEKEQADIQAALEESKAERLAAAEQDGVDLQQQQREAELKKLQADDKVYNELEAKFIKELGITDEYLRQTRNDSTSKTAELVRRAAWCCSWVFVPCCDACGLAVACGRSSRDTFHDVMIATQKQNVQGDTVGLDGVHIELGDTGVSFR